MDQLPPLDVTLTRARHVLVVDDEVGIRRVLARLIEKCGFQVTVAADGVEAREALALLPERAWTAIFCDVRMPREDGLRFAAHLEANAPSLTSRLVLLTGDTVSASVTAAATRTGCALMAKPFRAADVEQMLRLLTAREADTALPA